MSTVGGYSLDVYCDNCGHSDNFSGELRTEAVREARERGWYISRREAPSDSVAGGKHALCRSCARVAGRPIARPAGETQGREAGDG